MELEFSDEVRHFEQTNCAGPDLRYSVNCDAFSSDPRFCTTKIAHLCGSSRARKSTKLNVHHSGRQEPSLLTEHAALTVLFVKSFGHVVYWHGLVRCSLPLDLSMKTGFVEAM